VRVKKRPRQPVRGRAGLLHADVRATLPQTNAKIAHVAAPAVTSWWEEARKCASMMCLVDQVV